MTEATNFTPDELRDRALKGLGFFLVALAVLIFLPAWSLTFWQGWLYWLIFAAACVGITLYFLRHDPRLIESRLSAGASAESEPSQKTIQGILGVVFVALYVLSGLDHAFGWSAIPALLVLVADVAVILGFWIVFRTFRENGHASSIIEVKPDQPVVTTGPYALVRHPMYAGALLLLLATPVALGSWRGLLLFPLIVAGIAARLLDEERYLLSRLPAYAAYAGRTRFRLVPYVW